MGKITHICRVSHQLMMTQNVSPLAELDKKCELILMLLPPETRFLGVIEMAVVTMSRDFAVSFEHPAMPDCEIVFKYVRRVWTSTDEDVQELERLHQCSLVTGFDFILPDGTKWDGTDINKATLTPANGISLIGEE